MKKISSLINKAMAGFMILAFAFGSTGVGIVNIAHAITTPNWNTTGAYVINMEYLGIQYPHDLNLVQDGLGNLTGNGASPAGANIYTYDITSGLVDGDSITFTANYTATPDAVIPQTVLNVTGIIANDGTISGTWSDNYAGGERSGAISTVSGVAILLNNEVTPTIAIDLGTAANFAILAESAITDANPAISSITGNVGINPAAGSFITGLSCTEVAGTIYDDATYTGGYDSNVSCRITDTTLLGIAVGDKQAAYTAATTGTPAGVGATNLNVGAGTLTGNNFVPGTYTWNTPGDVNITGDITLTGTATDVWVFQVAGNLDVSSAVTIHLAGGALPANIFWAVAGTTTLKSTSSFEGNILGASTIALQDGAKLNGRALSKTDVTLIGNSISIPTSSPITTKVVTGITSSDATLNGTNGINDASGHSFWVSLNTFDTSSPTIPVGVYSTPDFGAISANTDFSATLSSIAGLPAITPNTKYYFTAWSNVDGTWYPGQVLSFTTATTGGEIGGIVEGEGVLAVSSVEVVDSTAIADGTFGNGWKYVFNVTIPTNETHLAMKFANWTQTGGSGSIAVANNMRISSLQANNGNATILITAANTYTTPTLNMISDLDPGLAGIQVQVTVETAVPIGSLNGSYTTNYGILTN